MCCFVSLYAPDDLARQVKVHLHANWFLLLPLGVGPLVHVGCFFAMKDHQKWVPGIAQRLKGIVNGLQPPNGLKRFYHDQSLLDTTSELV